MTHAILSTLAAISPWPVLGWLLVGIAFVALIWMILAIAAWILDAWVKSA